MTQMHSILPATLAVTLVLAIPALGQKSPEQEAQPAPNADEAAVTGCAVIPADAAEEQTYLGLGADSVPGFLGKHLHLPANTGLLVQSLDPEGPAAKAGFTVDDIITKVDGNEIASQRELANIIHARKPGNQLELDYIHEGKPGKRSVQLGAHQSDPQAEDEAAAGELQMIPGAGNLNDNLPPAARKLMREALEKARKNLGQQMNLQIGPGGAGGIQIMPGAGGVQILPGVGGMAGGMRFEANGSSSVQMTDGDGSIEMNHADGGSDVRVLDKAGKEVWSGPWETAQDKAAAPPDIRQRIDRLNIAPQGFKLNMQPGVQRRAAELKPGAPPQEPKREAPPAVPPSDKAPGH